MQPKAPVYIVDDDDAVRDSLAFLLTAADYQVTTFASGTEFLRHAPTLRLGCVIIDVRMPGVSGLEVQKRLNDLNLSHSVIIATGQAEIALAVQAMEAGAVDFIEKPFSEDALIESLDLAFARILTGRGSVGNDVTTVWLDRLSRAERKVLDGIMAGRTNRRSRPISTSVLMRWKSTVLISWKRRRRVVFRNWCG
jgi:two-component system response regulator FixJ